MKALIQNDLAALATVEGELRAARQGIEAALAADPGCEQAVANLAAINALAASGAAFAAGAGFASPGVAAGTRTTPANRIAVSSSDSPPMSCLAPPAPFPIKVAILSFLFNWPSPGGGNIHTAELALFLARAGYEVKHFYPRYPPWRIGQVGSTPFPSEGLDFTDSDWALPRIQERFRRAVDAFAPDYVLITDAWNMKPRLAEAMRGYRTLLRFQALECLCSLNNVRLLSLGDGRFAQCPFHQLAAPLECVRCLRDRGGQSGPLHRAERELAGVGTRAYAEILARVLTEADAVLVLNLATEKLVRPYAHRVQVVTWGMDPARFPPPAGPLADRPRKVIFQAGVVEEFMKGFHVLHATCARLWQDRQDFELVATGDPAGPVDAFTRFTGWASQEALPALYREADMVVVPTIAQEGLSRTSVEAMAAGRPVVASRIGGLPDTVSDGSTGLLCEPGDAEDLARKLEVLLDDDALRHRLGDEGRKQFEERFAWPVVIERDYRPLLAPVRTV